MINHFTFNGTSTAQLGLIVSGVSIFGAGSRKVEKAGIPGRNGDLQIELGGFNNYTVRYTVSITNDFTTTARQIREWLLESKGYCELTDTYHPDEIRKACFNSDIEFTTSMLYKYGQASIQFDCLPERYLTTNTPITTTATADTTTDTTMSLNTVPTPLNISLNGNTTQNNKNLLLNTATTRTTSGVTFTVNTDGTVNVNGTATADAYLIINNFNFVANQYTLSGCPSGGSTSTYALMLVGRPAESDTGSGRTVTQTVNNQAVGIYVKSGVTVTNLLFKPMIEKGTTATSYVPYLSPTNPQVIHNVSGDNIINVASKNIFNYEDVTHKGVMDDSGTISTINTRLFSGKIAVLPDTTYTFKTSAYSQNNERIYINRLIFYGKDGSFLRRNATYNPLSEATFTIPSDVYFLVFDLRTQALTTNLEKELLQNNTQLEKGSTATYFEPYTGQSYPLNLGSIELNKIGTYQDYIYKNGGKWYVHKAIGKSIINDIPWVYSSGSALFYATLANMTPAGLSRSDALCSTYPFNSGDDKFIATTSTQLRLIDSSYTDVTSLKSAMGDVEIYYQLATPTNTEITDTTLINQLNNIEKAYSYDGITNILQVSNDNGFMLSVVSLHGSTFNSNYKGEPIITVNSTGLIYLNGEVMEVLSAPVTINCQTMQCYNGVVNMNNEVRVNDFPEIKIGVNEVGSSMALTITPNNWRH